jgi:hypothetical protein
VDTIRASHQGQTLTARHSCTHLDVAKSGAVGTSTVLSAVAVSDDRPRINRASSHRQAAGNTRSTTVERRVFAIYDKLFDGTSGLACPRPSLGLHWNPISACRRRCEQISHTAGALGRKRSGRSQRLHVCKGLDNSLNVKDAAAWATCEGSGVQAGMQRTLCMT